MIAEFRQAVRELLTDDLSVGVYDRLPDDVAAVPCAIVGRPDVAEGDEAAIFDLSLDVWLIGNRNDAGDTELELDLLADETLALLGGTRIVRHDGVDLMATDVTARNVSIAELQYPAYSITVETSTTTC